MFDTSTKALMRVQLEAEEVKNKTSYNRCLFIAYSCMLVLVFIMAMARFSSIFSRMSYR